MRPTGWTDIRLPICRSAGVLILELLRAQNSNTSWGTQPLTEDRSAASSIVPQGA